MTRPSIIALDDAPHAPADRYIPVRIARPPRCPQCAEPGALIPLTFARGDDVDLLWLCRACRHQQPVMLEEIITKTTV